MPKQKTIGELIAAGQKAEMLTTAELAAKIGIDPNTVYRHKSGDRIPSVPTLRKYCDVLNIKRADAVAGTDEARKQQD